MGPSGAILGGQTRELGEVHKTFSGGLHFGSDGMGPTWPSKDEILHELDAELTAMATQVVDVQSERIANLGTAYVAGDTASSAGHASVPVASQSASGKSRGALNCNSIPVSSLIVDGRPMGSTPKMGLSVPAGTHAIVFVHPEQGRKVVTVTVAPGQSAMAATRFP